MTEVSTLLELAKATASHAGTKLLDSVTVGGKSYVHSRLHSKEIKAAADSILDSYIVQALAPTGLAILSEESGYIPAQQESNYWFIVDPLDGTFNFVKGLGPSAVSIALWQGERPIFGVIYAVLERNLIWGGAGMGAFADGRRISVSDTPNQATASICTGFPVRFDLGNDDAINDFLSVVRPYSKVRMIGCAAVSLVHVATGSADAYSEQNIMLWDVAAGLAIVDGAGGMSIIEKTGSDWRYKIFASNAHLLSSHPGAKV